MTEARIVNRGIDTFVLNAYRTKDGEPIKCDLDEGLAEELETWKKLAQQKGEYETSWDFNGRSLLMQPNGAGRGQWQWMLKTRDITLYISRGKWNGIASVRFSSQYLWSHASLMDAIIQVNSFLYDKFQDMLFIQPSEVHLCVDVANWHDITSLDRRGNFVSRSRKRGEYHEASWPQDMKLGDYSSGLQETGFDFSQRGAMSCTIYDKTREMKKSGKDWFADLWTLQRGWDQEQEPSVWRIEMKFKRQVLHELKQETAFHGIEEAYDLPERFPVMWAYAAGHVGGGADGLPDGWLRCVLPNGDTNRARWPTHPVWELIQGAFTEPMDVPQHFGKIIRKRQEEHNIEKALEAIIGYSTSASAWHGGKLAQPETDFSVFLHWLAENGLDLMERKGKDFSQEVRRKRILLGLEKK